MPSSHYSMSAVQYIQLLPLSFPSFSHSELMPTLPLLSLTTPKSNAVLYPNQPTSYMVPLNPSSNRICLSSSGTTYMTSRWGMSTWTMRTSVKNWSSTAVSMMCYMSFKDGGGMALVGMRRNRWVMRWLLLSQDAGRLNKRSS